MPATGAFGSEITGALLTEKVNGLTVRLASAGNIDHGQNPMEPIWGVPNGSRRVETLAEASKACRDYIDEHGLGGGSFTGGAVFWQGRQVARVSYNGRVWNAPDCEFKPSAPAKPAKAPRAKRSQGNAPSM
jgi:hypothetical protein